MARGGGNKKRFQYCTDPSGQEILFLRALQGHSGRNPIDPTLQDNVLIPNDFFEYIHHSRCAINLHSITNSGLIPGGQNLSKRQTVFFTSVDLMNKEHRDPNNIDLEAPRLAWYHQKKWKRHQDTAYWVDIKLAQKKRFKFDQTRCNAIILYDTLPAYCISKVVVMETGEIIYEKVYASPRPPPKMSFKDNWMKELGSEVARGGKDSQQTQPKIKNKIVRTVRPVLAEQPSGSLTQEIVLHRTSSRSAKDTKTRCIWVDIQLAQRNGLKFYQTRCNAIILYDTLPDYCISKVVVMESGEIIYEIVYVSPRPPPKISFKDNLMKELDSEVAGSSKDTQRIQPKPKKNYQERRDP